MALMSASRTGGALLLSAAARIMLKFNYLIGSRTRDLSACSIGTACLSTEMVPLHQLVQQKPVIAAATASLATLLQLLRSQS
jgi:hypothetical protein